ncbi:MAG: ABC transporter ATP-binding protein [Acholeplasmataceae bacterium]|nr:ABC transporter ATP-binding protein [Acholeplasmataceae bacterium]
MIEVKNLKKYYGSERGIEDVTMHVNEGEIFGFVGPNGSGKTTLIRILLGLIDKNSGDAKILGQEVKIDHKRLTENVGYLPSEAFFFDEMKVKGILSFFQNIYGADASYLSHLNHQLDVDINKKFGSLSFGNKKKVGIVVALMHQPKLIILDEPTSGLDPLIQSRFFDLLIEAKQQGATILLSSHVLSEIERVCDRVALIKDGVILFTKTMTEIRKSEHKKLVVKPTNSVLKLKGLTFQKDLNETSQYTYDGDINLLITFLNQHAFEDIDLRNLSLEEVFAIYYEKEEKQ